MPSYTHTMMMFMSRIAFGALCAMIVSLAAATFVEAEFGTQCVHGYVYGSGWFVALWAVAAVTALAVLVGRRCYRQPAVFLLHVAFAVILTGAFLTFATGVRGEVHLREGESTDLAMVPDDGHVHALPFSVRLDCFEIRYYPGTDAPSDYVSHLTIEDADGSVRQETVSMNKILSARGVRLYQTSYDADGKGTLLSVNHDAWGIPVTYAGYVLFGIGMLWLLLTPGGTFRRLLRHPLLKGGIGLCVVFLPESIDAQPRTLDGDYAGKLGDITVMYNGRIAPLQTMAYDLTLKLTGKRSYRGYSPEQVMAGWIFFPEEWRHEPMIRVKSMQLRQLLHVDEYAPLTAFFNDRGEYLPAMLAARVGGDATQSHLLRAISDVDEKVQVIRMLQQGGMLNIFPNETAGCLTWFSPLDELPEDMAEIEVMLTRNFFQMLKKDISDGDYETFGHMLDKFRIYQNRKAGGYLPSETRMRCEKLYNRTDLAGSLYKLNLAVGLVLLVLFVSCLVLPDNRRIGIVAGGAIKVARLALWCVLLALTAYVGLRAYISGRMPLGNGYETMIFIAWAVLLIAALFNRGFRLLVPFGFLLSGFALLVADLGQMNPQITPLMPVLVSPWLSIHVSVIMVAYALFAFVTLNGATALILHIVKRGDNDVVLKLMLASRIFLYPAMFFLGAGIFVGAVWANVSWGRYWAWDPKEVWALICFLVYGLLFHPGQIPMFRRPLCFHAFTVVAFFVLLMTFFGVNWLLGGMHSYS